MVQAIMLSENVNGSSKDWAKPAQMSSGGENSFTGEYDYEVNNKNAIIFFNQYFAPYLKYLKISEGSFADDKKEYSKIYFADGSVAAMKIGSCIDFQFDVNGEKKPNEYGRDIFVYFLCPSGLSMLDKNITFGPGALSPFNYSTRENAWQSCKSNNKTCSVLLQYYDNWEFKDDYPYKL